VRRRSEEADEATAVSAVGMMRKWLVEELTALYIEGVNIYEY